MRFLLGLLTVAGLIAAAASYMSRTGTDVVITNSGPRAIQVRGALPAGADTLLAAIGVRDLPDELRPGSSATIHVPSLTGEVVAAPGAISVKLFGQTMKLAAACDSLELDGATLLGRETSINLGERPRHDLRLNCR